MIKKLFILVVCAGLMSVLYAEPHEDEETKKLGGAGGLSVGMMWLDLDPLKEVVGDDLNREGFEFDNNRFMTIELIGYGGNRTNGFRIGWSGTFGYNTLYSNSWTGKTTDSAFVATHPDSLIDSVIQLHNLIAHGGLLVERSFNVAESFNLYVGGMLGGGVQISIADERLADDAFKRINSSNDNTYDDNHKPGDAQSDSLSKSRVAVAPLWVFDLHGGASYSLTKWMHIGLDASAAMYYSSTGFSYRQGSFMSVNPGLKVRLTFGNSV